MSVLTPPCGSAHAMEDCFVAAQKGTLVLEPEHVDILLRGVDLLVEIAQIAEPQIDAWQSEHAGAVDALVADLTAVHDERKSSQVAGSPPASHVVAPAIPVFSGDSGIATSGSGLVREDDDSKNRPSAQVVSAPTSPLQDQGPEQSLPETSVSNRDRDRVVRVTAASLTRLMGLAGEALVQSHRFSPLVESLWRLKGRQTSLLESLQLLEDRMSNERILLPAAEQELLAKSKSQAAQDLQRLGETVEAIEEFARGSEEISGRLHHEILTSRMRPLADGTRGFPRLVRDLARELGKQARFEVVGETTGVDRDILDRLEAPLNHLIRNALDHGLETPDGRRAAGKLPVGTIRLEVRHRAGMLQIVLADDGRGIDPARLRAKVVERGLTTSTMAAQLSETELLDFLFLPGFSTKEHVSEVSGRGVGLDVVQTMVHAVRGSVRVISRVGKGTRFVLQLPITVSVIRALIVEIGGEPYAFPLNRIDRIFMLNRADLRELEGKQHAMLDDQPIGLVEATRVFGLPADHVPGVRDLLPVVVASDRNHRFGVVVERFLGERDLRVSPLDARLGKVPNFNSSSVLENGWPVLVVDIEDLIRSIDNLLSGRQLGKLTARETERQVRARKRVLIVDDSITVRELERQLLENQGYTVDVAIDGVDGWNAVRSGHYDLVVSDIDMPRMDGIQLVEHIKGDARLKTIPVVIVSYKDREEDRIRGLDAGANAYLTKSSFHDQTFLKTVADLIGEPRE